MLKKGSVDQKNHKKLERGKVMSEVCLATRKLNFSIRFKVEHRKRMRTRNALEVFKEGDGLQFEPVYKQINENLCPYHKSQCSLQLKCKEDMA